MEQYDRLKREHGYAILFFRLGDFYEMFKEDALEVSALLDLTLTRRNGQPMCGVPYHSSRSYIARLLKLGRKVAVCEQVGQPGKGLMERRVVEVITPGTMLDEEYLDRARNNWLLSLCRAGEGYSISAIDLSTGEFTVSLARHEPDAAGLRRELARYQPREILVQQSLLDDPGAAAALEGREGMVLNRLPDWCFDARSSAEKVKNQLGTASLKGFGLDDASPEIRSAGALLDYLRDAAAGALSNLRGLTVSSESDYVGIDESSMRNLEIVQNLQDAGRTYCLLEVMDETKTAMGARALRRRLLSPLKDVSAIAGRLDRIESLYRDQALLARLRACLGACLDLERLSSRIALGRANARDLLAVADSLRATDQACARLEGLAAWQGCLPGRDLRIQAVEAADRIRGAIIDEPSVLLSEGHMIREGLDPELDSLKALERDSRSVLDAYLEEEKAASGIANLKLKHNNLIGFHLEVGKAQAGQVPAHFIRRQGLASGERFTSLRLQELEARINGARERIVEIERRLFLELRDDLAAKLPILKAMAAAVAEIDVSAGLAFAATRRGWTRPIVDSGDRLFIREGRHPIVEAHLPEGAFIPNDIDLCLGGKSFALITGPNMAGKSTFLRQTALITLMAQAGSFVPAAEARIGLVDRIFCRVGAQDNLARGESTFLVEMNETAYILNTAGPRSLIIMDEVGRGTSTTDGLAIAWAVSERLSRELGARSLFATHYHELASLSGEAVLLLCLEAEEREGQIVFLKKVAPGAATSSYGIQVAALAGMPAPVLRRAEQIRAELERTASTLPSFLAGQRDHSLAAPQPIGGGKRASPAGQLFDDGEALLEEIRGLDVEAMTPLEAITRVAMWKKLLSKPPKP
jgi:DNA mismatch repair protein MutS